MPNRWRIQRVSRYRWKMKWGPNAKETKAIARDVHLLSIAVCSHWQYTWWMVKLARCCKYIWIVSIVVGPSHNRLGCIPTRIEEICWTDGGRSILWYHEELSPRTQRAVLLFIWKTDLLTLYDATIAADLDFGFVYYRTAGYFWWRAHHAHTGYRSASNQEF